MAKPVGDELLDAVLEIGHGRSVCFQPHRPIEITKPVTSHESRRLESEVQHHPKPLLVIDCMRQARRNTVTPISKHLPLEPIQPHGQPVAASTALATAPSM